MSVAFTIEITLQPPQNKSWPIAAVLKSGKSETPPRWCFSNLSFDDSWREDLLSVSNNPEDYGRVLGRALFTETLQALLKDALVDSEHIRLFLVIEAPELKSIHWERTYFNDETGQWTSFAQDQRILFSLYEPGQSERYYPRFVQRELKTLVVINSPHPDYQDAAGANFSTFDTDLLAGQLSGINKELPDTVSPPVILSNAPNNSWRSMTAALNTGQYHILHIVCHGFYHESSQESYLAFQNEDQRLEAISTKQFVNDLKKISPLPQLIFLSSCDTAHPEASVDSQGQFAQHIRQALGTPAVIAMSGKVAQSAANTISQTFYPHLLSAPHVDIALSRASHALYQDKNNNRFMPVLRQRLGHESLFGLSEWSIHELNTAQLTSGLKRLEELLPERAPMYNQELADILTSLDLIEEEPESKLLTPNQTTFLPNVDIDPNLEVLDRFCHDVTGIDFATLTQDESSLPEYDSRCPFPGMEPFKNTDRQDFRQFFFGRDKDIAAVCQKLIDEPIVAVVGSSGSGKSSLVFAGILPKLATEGWQLLGDQQEGIRLQLSDQSQQSGNLEAQLNQALESLDANQKTLLYLDQFEQVFVGSDEHYLKQRQTLFKKLFELPKQFPKLRVLLTIRADYALEDAKQYLGDIITEQRYDLSAFTTPELRQLIEQQVASTNLIFDDGLAHRIQSEVIEDQKGVLPLLQYLLWQLWQRRKGRLLRTQDYEALNGIQHVVTTIADRVFEQYEPNETTPQEYKDAQYYLRNIFMRLTQPDKERKKAFGDHYRDIKQPVAKASLYPFGVDEGVIDELLITLHDERLITTRIDGAGKQQVEIVHESLIQYWDKLRGWLQDRQLIEMQQELSEYAQHWSERSNKVTKRNSGRLENNEALRHSGSQIKEVCDQEDNQQLFLNSTEQEYLGECKRKDIRIEKNRKRVKVFSWFMAFLLIIVSTMLIVALNLKYQSDERLASQYFDQGLKLKESNMEAGIANTYFSKAVDATWSHQYAYNYAITERQSTHGDLVTVFEHGNSSPGINIFENGEKVVTWSYSGLVRIWDIATGDQVNAPIQLRVSRGQGAIEQRSHGIKSLNLSDNNLMLVGVDTSGGISIVNLLTGQDITPTSLLGKSISQAKFFDNDSKLLIELSNGIRVWDIIKREEVNICGSTPRLGYSSRMNNESVFMRSSKFIAGESKGSICILDLESEDLFDIKHLGIESVESGLEIRLFDNGSKILVWNRSDSYRNNESVIKLWDLNTRSKKTAIVPQKLNKNIREVFILDENKFLVLTDKSTVHIWDSLVNEFTTIPIKFNSSLAAKTVVEGNLILFSWKSELDVKVSIWDINSKVLVALPDDHRGEILSAQELKGKKQFLTVDSTNIVRLWDAKTLELISKNIEHTHSSDFFYSIQTIKPMNRSPKLLDNDSKLLTRSENGSLSLWELTTGVKLWSIMPNGLESFDDVHLLAGSGQLLTSSSKSGDVQIWDFNIGKIIANPLILDEKVLGGRIFASGKKILTWNNHGEIRIKDLLTRVDLFPPLFHKKGERQMTRTVKFNQSRRARVVRRSSSIEYNHSDTQKIERQQPNPTNVSNVRVGDIPLPSERNSTPEEVSLEVDLFAEGTKLLTYSRDGMIRFWDILVGKEIYAPLQLKYSNSIGGVRLFSNETRLLTWSHGGRMYDIWDVSSQKKLANWKSSGGKPTIFANGTKVATSADTTSESQVIRNTDGEIINSNLKKLNLFKGLASHNELVCSEAYQLIAQDNRIKVLTVDRGSLLKDFSVGAIITEVNPFKESCGVLIWTSDGLGRIFNPLTGVEAQIRMDNSVDVVEAGFLDSETKIWTLGSDDGIRIWDLSSFKQVGITLKHTKAVEEVYFLSDERRLFTQGKGGTILLWDVVTGEIIGTPMNHAGPIEHLELSEDESIMLVVAGQEGRLWMLPDQSQDIGFNHEIKQAIKSGFYINDSGDSVFLSSSDINSCMEEIKSIEDCNSSSEAKCWIKRKVLGVLKLFDQLPRPSNCVGVATEESTIQNMAGTTQPAGMGM
ncbi:CHAT domain-containing protein [Leucothrix arctica]|uniref:CHAT domain-containing protein n=1 Tax=Leucothrix arctica TaxID=1481894 RepID=A0A317C7V8_9GAMM|nr:CHAT domain-containing protein [Leucothrix arctica]PWQ94725.1 hypothetical protein DKT75_15680 [Leucothrix arctica]